MKRRLVTLTCGIIITALASVVAFAKGYEFHDGVYRGEKWEFDFGQPKKNHITIIPQDRVEPKVYGNGYVGRVEIAKKEYEIILLGN